MADGKPNLGETLRRAASVSPDREEFMREVFKSQKDLVDTDHRRWSEIWQVSLAVGNGAAFLGVAGFIMSGDASRWLDALLLSSWVFFIGLLAGGSIPFLKAERLKTAGELLSSCLGAINSATEFKRSGTKDLYTGLLIRWAPKIAAVAFVVGILVPLVSITIWR